MSTSNIFSNVYIYGNCTVKGTLTTLGGSAVSQWTTGGSAIYYSTGNVGIGTNNPSGVNASGTVLHVSDSTANNPTVHVDASVGTGQARLHLRSGTGSTNRASRIDFFNNVLSSTVPQWTIISGYDQNGTNDMRYVNYAGAITMAWAQNGNIGIGTTNPGSLLTVSGGGSFGSGYNAFTAPTGGLIVQGNVGIGTSNPGLNALQVSGNVVTQGFTSNATNTVFNFDTLTVPFVNATQVGVGTTSSTYPFDVLGIVRAGSTVASSIYLTNSEVKWRGDGTAHFSIFNQNSTFQIRNTSANFEPGTAGSNLVTVTSTGNVGIGTTSPIGKLSVSVAADAENMAVGAWSDRYFCVGQNPTSTSSCVSIGYNNTTNQGWIYSLGPSVAWRGLNYGALSHSFYCASTTPTLTMSGTNVGIGSTNPGYLVDIAGDVNSTGSFRINTILQPKVYHYNSFNGVTSFDAGNFDLVNFNNVEIRVIPAFNTVNSGALQIQALDTAGTVYGAGEPGYVVWQGNRSTAFQYGGSATVFGNTELITNGVGPYICIVRITSINAYTGSQRFHVQWTSTGCWAGTGAATDTGQCFFATTNIQLNRIRFNLTAGTMTGKYSIVHYL